MLPAFFIIGAQKAGSTFLLQCLDEHPQIFMPPYEVAFFESEAYSPERIGEFAKHFDTAQNSQVIGVKRANVLGNSESAPRLKHHMPDLRLIAILRHPLERTLSGYFQYMASGFVPIVSAEDGLTCLLDGQYVDYPRANEIINFGKYAKHLRRFESFFPRDQIHIVLLDDVKIDAERELQRIYQFLDVDDQCQTTPIQRRPMAAVYSLPRLRLRAPLDRLARDRATLQTAQIYRTGLLARSARTLNAVLDRGLWARIWPGSPPQLSQELSERILREFLPDIENLEQWLGRDLNAWKQVPAKISRPNR